MTIDIQSKTKGTMQVFYASKGNYTEANSIKVFITSTNTFKSHIFKLPKSNIKKIRIDPTGDFKIKSINISNVIHNYKFDGQLLYESIVPLHDIESIDLIDNQVIGIVNGTDPFIDLINLPTINPTFTLSHLALLLLLFAILFLSFYTIWEYWLKGDFNKSSVEKRALDIPSPIFYSLLAIIFLWFLFQTVFYASYIAPGIAPDEYYHILLSSYQSETFSIYNHDSPRSFYLGAISVRPYFYHMLMGKLLMLNSTPLTDVVFLRLINVLLGMLTLYLTFLLVKEISKNKLILLAALVIQTNVLMYVFLSSMVSYDNLVNLIAVGSFVSLLRFLKTYSRRNLMVLIITMMVGALTKITYGPIIVVQFIILLYHAKPIIRNRKKILSKTSTITDGLLLISILILFGLNIHLYGNNLIKYGQVQPKTVKVFGHEKAYKYYSQYQRAYDLKSTRNEKTIMRFDEYFIKYLRRTGDTIFGICGHKNLLRSNLTLLVYGILGFLSLLIFVVKYKQLKRNEALKVILFSLLSYALIILLANYSSYRALGSLGLALQGRYNFPVIALASVFIAFNLLSLFKDRTKIIILVVVTGFLVYSSFFWSLSKFTADWFIK